MFGLFKNSAEEKSASAIIVAGGSGERLGMPQGKALVEVFGQPMIVHSLLAFEQANTIGRVVVVAREIDILAVYDIVNQLQLTKVAKIICGGQTRQESVRLGLNEVADGYVAVHDCARPCITSEMIDEVVGEALSASSAMTLGIQVTDTIKRVANNVIVEEIERDGLWQVQTPQVFDVQKLKKSHEKAIEDGYEATDDATLMRNFGEKVRVVMGSSDNIKITTKSDIYIAESIMQGRVE